MAMSNGMAALKASYDGERQSAVQRWHLPFHMNGNIQWTESISWEVYKRVCVYQSICVVAHVPERNEGQGDSAAILSRDLILTGHHRGYGPPVNQTNTINMFLVLIWRSFVSWSVAN